MTCMGCHSFIIAFARGQPELALPSAGLAQVMVVGVHLRPNALAPASHMTQTQPVVPVPLRPLVTDRRTS